MVLPEMDAVVVITSGVRDMQKVMNLVWDILLPTMKPGRLPENATARRQLESRLAGLTVKLPRAAATSSLAASISGKWYEFAENDRGIKAVSLDFKSSSPALIVQTANGETRTPIGMNSWARSRGSFTNGLDHFLSVPENPLVAASGAWSGENTFTVKIVLYETPFYSTVNFKFEGNRMLIDAEHNVAFGQTKLAQLIGQSRAVE